MSKYTSITISNITKIHFHYKRKPVVKHTLSKHGQHTLMTATIHNCTAIHSYKRKHIPPPPPSFCIHVCPQESIEQSYQCLIQKFVLLCDRLVHRPDGSSMEGGRGGDLSTQLIQFHHSLGSVYFSQSYCVCMACFGLMLDISALLLYINYTQSVILDRSLNDHTRPAKILQPQHRPGKKTHIHRVAKLLNGTVWILA